MQQFNQTKMKLYLKLSITVILLLTTISSYGQKSFEYQLWPNGAPNDNGITVAEDTSKEPWFNVKTARLTVFKSDKPDSKCIIMCPGGGYGAEYWINEGVSFAPWMHAQNITFIVLKYRLPNKGHYEVPLSDAQEALREARAHAKEWNIDPNAVGIMGASAGGHLAASAGTLSTSPENHFNFQILLYPVITMNDAYTHLGTRENLLGTNPSKELIERYSLERQVNGNTSRAFIVLAEDDRTVKPINCLNYYEALVEHHIPSELLIYPYGDHGFGCKDSFAFKQQWLNELEHWLHTF